MLRKFGLIVSTLIFTLYAFTYVSTVGAGQSSAGLLERFFNNVRTYQADFTQVVMDAEGNSIQESSGRFWIKRPGKFRWDYKKPFTQKIIGDGKKVWIYDPELKQVTVKDYQGSVSQTPALMLAGNQKLTNNFIIKNLGTKKNITWLSLKSKGQQENFSVIKIGFKNKKLLVLELVDSFGQTTRINLKKAKENLSLKKSIFKFKPPKGVDVVGQQ